MGESPFWMFAPSTISVLAIKQAEDSSNAMILRMQERSGKHTSAHIESSLLQLSHDVSFSPWELKTLRIESSKHGKAKCAKCRLSKPKDQNFRSAKRLVLEGTCCFSCSHADSSGRLSRAHDKYDLKAAVKASVEPIGSARPGPRTDPRNIVSRARPYRCGTP